MKTIVSAFTTCVLAFGFYALLSPSAKADDQFECRQACAEQQLICNINNCGGLGGPIEFVYPCFAACEAAADACRAQCSE